jgi:hypothetical protein
VLGAANQGLFASASGDTDADHSSTWPAPSLLQAWDQSNVWERSFVRGQSSAGPTLVRTSLSSGESSGVSAPETRRSSGRRLWDALSRGTFHRRTSTLTMAALADLEENSMPLGDVEQLVDTETLHGSRSLDLNERRRRVRSQVGLLTLVEWCLACGQSVMSSTSSGHELYGSQVHIETQICVGYYLQFLTFHLYDQCYRYGHCVD